jgi:hypothetical protein
MILLVASLLVAGCALPVVTVPGTPLPAGGSSSPGQSVPSSGTTDFPSSGTIDLTLTADRGAADDDVVSLGVPFPPGALRDETQISVLDPERTAVAIHTRTLARWPADDTVRSVLVAFPATLDAGASQKWTIEYGQPPRGGDTGSLEPNPDGPVIATLPARHYAASRVSGIILPEADNQRFEAYDDQIASSGTEKPLQDYGLVCSGGAEHRTYYDGTHALYQRGLRSGDPAELRAAHDEAVWYRANELEWIDADRTVAITKCEAEESGQPSWTPETRPLDWSTIRMMSGQGSLDDYLVTGDPAARQALAGFGEAYIRNLPLLEQGTLEITERNLGWSIMGVVSYYAVDPSERVRAAADSLVTRAFDWQARGSSGALEHDINRPDPDECYGGDEDPNAGPRGASPFMTSLVVDGVMDWWLLTNDPRVTPFLDKLARWYERDAITTDRKAFQYLWGCMKYQYDPGGPPVPQPDGTPNATGDPDGFTSPELNILIAHVFGATAVVTRDRHWIEFGDSMAEAALEYMYVGTPKAWNQQNRSFGKYLGYRVLVGAAP